MKIKIWFEWKPNPLHSLVIESIKNKRILLYFILNGKRNMKFNAVDKSKSGNIYKILPIF